MKFLQEARQAASIQSTKTSDPAALREQLLGIGFTDNQKTDRKLSDLVVPNKAGQLESKPSLGSILKDTGLRTLCSVSGTTTDIVAGLVAHMGKDAVTPMLDSLKAYVAAGCPKPPAQPQLSNDFKELFLAAAMYMQSGQHHSEGEVLAGFYTSALTLTNDSNAKDFDAIAPTFQKMWEALKDRPADFYPLSDGDKRSLDQAIPGIVGSLQAQHVETMKGRHAPVMAAFQEQHEARLTPQQSAVESALLKNPEQQEAEEQKLRDEFRKEVGLEN
jgi:hypothetical protein